MEVEGENPAVVTDTLRQLGVPDVFTTSVPLVLAQYFGKNEEVSPEST